MKLLASATLAIALVAVASAQPTISSGGILNVASYALPGLPNSSIAQGSIFVIFGTNLGPSMVAKASAFPIPTVLGGTSVTVSAGGQTFPAPMIYTTPTQVAAILPSATPVGAATATVSYQGGTSNAQSFQVVTSSFGTFSVNQQGNGSGIITNAQYQVFLANSAALAGDAAILWGTGLGPVSNDSAQPTPGNLSVPVKVYVGSQQAQVSYQGRSGCCSGLDQIVFTVPSGITGCSVPVVVVINNVVSNTTTFPVGDDSTRTCSDPIGLTATELAVLKSKGSLKLGYLDLTRTTTNDSLLAALGQPSETTSDTGSATFVEFTPATLAGATFGFQVAAVGSCLVYTFSGSSTSTGPQITIPVGLDAGPNITVAGPNGMMQLPQSSMNKGSYYATLSTGTPPNVTLFLSPGGYTFTNGSGGADVGGFTANETVPQPLTWTNMSTVVATPINRAQGVTVNWTGASPGTYVRIDGASLMTDQTGMSGVFALFTCLAPAAAGTFTVGPNVLLQLPASTTISENGVSFSFSSLSVANAPVPVTFTAPGLDYGFLTSSFSSSATVTYQ